MNDMTRFEKISILEMVTRISYEYLQNCSKEEIDKLYHERVEVPNEIHRD